jgi:hypothetical protein
MAESSGYADIPAKCIVCDSEAKEPRGVSGARVCCPRCGVYGITELVRSRLLEVQTWDPERKRLSQALRFASDRGRPIVLEDIKSVMDAIAELDQAEQSAKRSGGS